MASQCEMVLDHLKNHGSISSREAEKEYGIARLAARIRDLTRMGVQIRTEMVQGKNRYGKPVHYARYFLSEVDKMILDNDVEIVRPNQDGPYRLRRCKCGSDNVAYIRGVDSLWRVRCFDCGHTGDGAEVQHDAQVKWNGASGKTTALNAPTTCGRHGSVSDTKEYKADRCKGEFDKCPIACLLNEYDF